MAAWKKGLVWLASGSLIVALALAFTILLGEKDTHGARLAVFVTLFYAAFTAGAIALVRGALYLLRLDRNHAAMLVVATIAGIVLAILLHNLVYAVTGVEEGFFFLLALLVGPVVLVAAVVRLIHPFSPAPHH